MNYTYENYLYIYNIKLIKKNLLIKKITFKYLHIIFFKTKTILQNLVSKNNLKNIYKLYSQKLFSEPFLKTAIKHAKRVWKFLTSVPRYFNF